MAYYFVYMASFSKPPLRDLSMLFAAVIHSASLQYNILTYESVS